MPNDDGMEAALAASEEQFDQALRAAGVVARELKKAKTGANVGNIRELRRAAAAAVTAAAELAEAAEQAAASYDLDESEHLGSGAYAKELLALAAERGLGIIEEDDRLLCYPSLVRILPGDAAIEVDRKRNRRLRPSVVLDHLAAAQQRPLRSKSEPFLASVLSAYELLAGRDDKPDPVVRLDAIWNVLTLLPGQARDYSKPEFTRDLYLLDQSQVVAVKGRTLRWHASSGTRGPGVLTTVAKTGQQQRYWGISFTPK